MILVVGDYLDDVVERVPMSGHEGKSGALLGRVTFSDSRRRIVKRSSRATDLLMAGLGDEVGREYTLWSRGILDHLPPEVVDASREQIIADYAEAAGPAYDEPAMRLSLLSSLVWLGWNKALDAAENPDEAVRAREQEDLDWWVNEARLTLDAGLL